MSATSTIHARDDVAGVDRFIRARPNTTLSYSEAQRKLLRDSVFDALRVLLEEQDWQAVSLVAVAKKSGISRQTIYKTFGSRNGLAQAYAISLADLLSDRVDDAVWANVDDPRNGVIEGMGAFFAAAAADPLVRAIQTGNAHNELLRLITTDSGPIMLHASQRLATTFEQTWVGGDPDKAAVLARATIRLVLSYISMPPEIARDVPADLAMLFVPFVEAHRAELV